MKYVLVLLLVVFYLPIAHGQTRFNAGPQIGLNIASASYRHGGHAFDTKYVLRGAIGAAATVGRKHLDLQVSALYSQKGFRVDDSYEPYPTAIRRFASIQETYQLNYIYLPINLAYTQQANGQGFQGFAGGYASLLLNGRLKYENTYLVPQRNGDIYGYYDEGEINIRPRNKAEYPNTGYLRSGTYSKPIDAGVQAGAGYRSANLLIQITYAIGLVNLKPDYPDNAVVSSPVPSYYIRTGQVSVTYLFGMFE